MTAHGYHDVNGTWYPIAECGPDCDLHREPPGTAYDPYASDMAAWESDAEREIREAAEREDC